MTYAYGTADPVEAEATIARALELGVDFFDTAEIYGPHTNEVLVGNAIRARRDEVFLATKFGIVRDPERPTLPPKANGRPSNVRASIDGSLKRLGVEQVDLYYLHRVDPSVAIEETVGAMGDLVRAGKVRFLGLSEAGPETIRRAHKEHPITALQSEYSLWTRDHEEEVIPTCRELGIGFVPYSPLSRGLLAGRIRSIDDLTPDDGRRQVPRFQGENLARNLAVTARLSEIAAARGVDVAALAIAWLLVRGDDVIPLMGTSRADRVDRNLEALAIELSAEDLAEIDAAAPIGAASGERYPTAHMPRLGV
jgi:aryl-alcohol dehydrogenase-like predicted oxidoreductase